MDQHPLHGVKLPEVEVHPLFAGQLPDCEQEESAEVVLEDRIETCPASDLIFFIRAHPARYTLNVFWRGISDTLVNEVQEGFLEQVRILSQAEPKEHRPRLIRRIANPSQLLAGGPTPKPHDTAGCASCRRH